MGSTQDRTIFISPLASAENEAIQGVLKERCSRYCHLEHAAHLDLFLNAYLNPAGNGEGSSHSRTPCRRRTCAP